MSTPGTYTVTFSALDAAGNASLVETRTFEVVPPEYTPVEVAGPDRYSTAVEVSQLAFPDGAEHVVIASGANWPDALGGGALAGTLRGPVLLVKPTQAPEVVLQEVARLGAEHVIVVGGKAAIGDSVLAALDMVPTVAQVERIGGVDRYDTSRLIALRVKTERDLTDTYDGVVFIATGENYPDALAASPLAAHNSWPILLTRYGALPVATQEALVSLHAGEAFVLGGPAVISLEVEREVNDIVTRTKAQRLAGSNRFDTAVKVADFGIRLGGLGWDGAALATGRSFPDALAGGAAQGMRRAPILLTEPDTLPSATAGCLSDHRGEIVELWFLGGEAAIGADVRDQVAQILQ